MKKKKTTTLDRKKFIKTAALGIGAIGIGACTPSKETESDNSPNIITSKKYKWKMVTTWPPNFPVLGEGAKLFAEWIKIMSGGRMEIKVYGGGELVPALEVFEAVNSGASEMGHGASYYWAGKAKATQFFTAIPFGLNSQQMYAWLLYGGGYELWRELYAGFNLVPFVGGNTGVQMAGWFNKPIESVADFKGLKMRIPGLGGKVIEELGGTAVLSAGSEIYTNLERGVIDATEWIGPYHDYLMGFHNIAKYYYAPGWHEPGAVLETIVNKRAYDKLPLDLQTIIAAASERLALWVISEFEAKNIVYFDKIINESNVEVKVFDKSVINAIKKVCYDVLDGVATSDPESKKIYDNFSQFRTGIKKWAKYSEQLYHDFM